MTYFGVLGIFILPPLGILLLLAARQRLTRQEIVVLLAHVTLALIYTTPWDNYLVANGVWWYNPRLVTGFRLGWVPIEEYTFFVLQTLLTGLWYLVLQRGVPERIDVQKILSTRAKNVAVGLIGLLWGASLVLLFSGWQPGTYLALILSWGLVPVLVQLVFGMDILLARGRVVLLTILVPTIYLWLMDALAISSGTWTIDPAQTTGLMVGALPLEEMVFFMMTNVIIAFGMRLMLSGQSQERLRRWMATIRGVKFESRLLFWLATVSIWLAVWIATPMVLWFGGDEFFSQLVSLGVLAQTAATLTAIWLGPGDPAFPGEKQRNSSLSRVILLTVQVFGLAWLVETLGLEFGLPFGNYAYSQALQPQIRGVPAIIPLAWLMMLPTAWAVAELLLQPVKERLRGSYWLAYALLAGAAFTAWDLYLDPQMVARGLWSWQNPVGYFGIPWSNYAGWWLAGTFITLVLRPSKLPRRPLLVIYSLTWVFQAIALGMFWGQPGPALIGLVGMGFFSIAAWKAELKAWRYFSGQLPLSSSAPYPSP